MRIGTERIMTGQLFGCVILEEGDDLDAEEVMEIAAMNDGAYDHPEGEMFMVGFPGLSCQLYTERALRRSLPLRK